VPSAHRSAMSAINSAGDAFEAYTKGEFETCGQYLEQIHNLKTAADVKVTHNILVNDYFKAGCADPHNLLTLLTQAYERAREKEKKDKGKRKKEEDDEDGIREDDDLYVLRYNQALLCVQLRHYAQARQILEELFENIEPIDDFLAIKICFLLLEVVLLQKEPEQALQILNFLEKPNAFHSLLKPERKPLEAPRPIEDEEEVEGEQIREEEEPAEAVAAAADTQQPEKPEGPLPSLVFGACLQRHGRAPDAISPIEFRFTCLTYKIRVHILCRSMKSAKKECKNAMEILEHELQHVPLFWKESQSHEARGLLHNHDWAKVTCLKAYLEYAKQNHRKAFRLLTLCRFNFAPAKPGDKSGVNKPGDDEVEDHMPTDFHPAQDDACSPLFYNNMGCIHFMMHKPNLAIYYFNKALSKSAQAPAGASGPVEKESLLLSAKVGLTQPGMATSRHWLDRRAEITFNAGLQFLMTGRPAQAYKCFIQCTFVFRNWPRLWMRLAECCIELYRQSHKAEPEGGSKPGGMQSWNRVKQPSPNGPLAMGGSICTSLGGPTALGSGMSQLASAAQGCGPTRRLSLLVDKTNVVGKLGSGEDVEQRTGPAGAAPSVPQATKAPAAEGDVLNGEDPLVTAAMCLKNVLTLIDPMLQSAAQAAETAEANAAAAGKAAPSQKASGSGAPTPSKSATARDLAEAEALLMEDAALLKLAYVCLCQRDHTPALRYAKRILDKNHLLPAPSPEARTPDEKQEQLKKNWTIQAQNLPHPKDAKVVTRFSSSLGTIASAVSYTAEALSQSGKVLEAKTLVTSFGEKTFCKAVQQQVNFIAEQERNHNAPSSTMLSTTVMFEQRADKKEEGLYEGCHNSLLSNQQPTTNLGGITPPSFSINCASAAHQGKERDAKDAKGENDREKTKDGSYALLVAYESTMFPTLGDMQSLLFTNMAVAMSQDGLLEEARKYCDKALQIQPRALLPLRTLSFLLLKQGHGGEAIRRLKGEKKTVGQ